MNWLWNLENGQTSNFFEPQNIIYDNCDQDYEVNLTIWDSDSLCSNNFDTIVYIRCLPEVSFSSIANCSGDTVWMNAVVLLNESNSIPIWNWGDMYYSTPNSQDLSYVISDSCGILEKSITFYC